MLLETPWVCHIDHHGMCCVLNASKESIRHWQSNEHFVIHVAYCENQPTSMLLLIKYQYSIISAFLIWILHTTNKMSPELTPRIFKFIQAHPSPYTDTMDCDSSFRGIPVHHVLCACSSCTQVCALKLLMKYLSPERYCALSVTIYLKKDLPFSPKALRVHHRWMSLNH